MMNDLTLGFLDVADVSAMGTITVEEVEASGIAEVKSHPLYADFKNENSAYKESLTRMRKSENTTKKNADDKNRDDAFIGMRRAVSGFTCLSDPQVRAKALHVYGILDMYGAGVERLAFEKETEYLTAIIGKLNEPENLKMVVDIGVKPFLDNLESCENTFRTSWGSHESDKEEFRNSESATTSRRKLEEAIGNLFGFISYSAKYAPTNREAFAKLERAIYSRYLTIRHKYSTTKTTTDEKPAK